MRRAFASLSCLMAIAAGAALSEPHLVRDINTFPKNTRAAGRGLLPGSDPSGFMPAGNTLYFLADDGWRGKELWKSDGTRAGTALVQEFFPGAAGSIQPYLPSIEADGVLFARLALEIEEPSLWRISDRGAVRLTPEGVAMSHDNIFQGRSLAAMGDKIFFSASDSRHGRELWVTDGNVAGTRMVSDLKPGSINSDPAEFTFYQGLLFFSAEPPSSSTQVLWKSDGTRAGTVRLPIAGRKPAHLTVHQGFLYFFAETNEHGSELWRSDGTEAGTHMVADLVPGRGALTTQAMLSFGSRLLFWGSGKLWVSDGTKVGTRAIGSVELSLSPRPLALGSVVYFCGRSSSGDLLWRTNGTVAGTFPLRGPDGLALNKPDSMAIFDGRLYFVSEGDCTLWESNGTPKGTMPIRRLRSQGCSSRTLAVAGSRLFFPAFDETTGLELWAIDKKISP